MRARFGVIQLSTLLLRYLRDLLYCVAGSSAADARRAESEAGRRNLSSAVQITSQITSAA
ncbi:MAG: hypothetical protein ACRCTM_18655 [Sphaerotilus sulfidivorans]